MNFFQNVKVQKARISASGTVAAGIGGYTVRVEDSEISGCDIYAATAYASGRLWQLVEYIPDDSAGYED